MKRIITLLFFVLVFSSAYIVKAQTYCAPTYNNTCCMGFSNVQFNTINNNSAYGNCTSAFYENYTSSVTPTDVFPGFTYTLRFTVASYDQYVDVWIDFNGDGDFYDTGEKVYSTGSSYLYYGSQYSVNITIPVSATPGQTRLRIMGNYYGMGVPAGNPCGPVNYGDTEDYPLNIQALSGFDLAVTKLNSPEVFKVDSNELVITATNLAKDTIKWFDLGYSLNGGVPELVYDFYPTNPLSGGQGVQYTFSKKVFVPTKGNHELKVWVSNANDIIPDDKPENDTIVINFCTGMSGTYTIGAGGDFTTFNLAYNELLKCGITGPIVFNVLAGNYNEVLVMKPIAGMSATNTVSFVGAGKNLVNLTSS
jgi:hypothetical protein